MRWCSRCGGPNNRRPTCDAGLHGLFQHDWSYCLLLLFCGTELRPGPPFENLDEMSEIEIGVSLRKAEGDELTGLLADRHRHAKPFSLREAETNIHVEEGCCKTIRKATVHDAWWTLVRNGEEHNKR